MGIFLFLRNKIERNGPRRLTYGIIANKNHWDISFELCVNSKMDMKNVKILLKLALKRATS
jgi:hypothetical protein